MILIIDDDVDAADALEAVLTASGHEALTVSDGERALTLCAKLGWSMIDLVLCDMVMPVLDGLGFLRAYLERAPAPAPVVAMSSLEAYLDAARTLGAVAAVSKPIDVPDLLQLIDALLEKRVPAAWPKRGQRRDESARLAAIDELRLEDADVAPLFSPFVARVARAFDVPICLLSIIDATQQHWSAQCGVPNALALDDAAHTREESFCTHAVEARAPLLVQNAADSPVFAANYLVRTHHLRFYAGVPVLTLLGEPVGTLCVLDFRPHAFGHNDLRLLELLAERAAADITRRDPTATPGKGTRHEHLIDAETGSFALASFLSLVGIEAERRIEHAATLAIATVEVAGDAIADVARRLEQALAGAWIGRLSPREVVLLLDRSDDVAALAGVVGAAGRVRVADLTGRLAPGIDLVREATRR